MEVVPLQTQWIDGAVALQRECFPPPFDPDLLWKREHLERHLQRFPDGQFVAISDGEVVGSATALVVSELDWDRHGDWNSTVGGHFLENHRPDGTTLYGVDVSVHPRRQGQGVGRALYEARFDLVRKLELARFGTACRMPDWRSWVNLFCIADKREYVRQVVAGEAVDRTLTPLLKMGLRFVQVLPNYMEDVESGNAAALLEWQP